MPTSPTPITALPTPPSRSDSANFATRGDAFLGALPTFRTEANALATNAYNNAVEADADAVAAEASRVAAAAQVTLAAAQATLATNMASAAAAAASASVWVSGTSYSIGNVVYSPVDYLGYRRITNGAGTTDPSADATNWAPLVPGLPKISIVSGTSVSAVASNHYVLTNAATTTVTLPASPNSGDAVWITVANGRTDNVIARNGKPINTLAEDMTLDSAYAGVQLRYADATRGWIFT